MTAYRKLRHNITKSKLRLPLMWWRHRHVHPEDVWLASYPRSGNTWLRFLLYELVTGQTADFATINDPYSPCADFPRFQATPVITPSQGRFIKTHEPYRKEYGRAIYLVRDPRDVAVSEYYYMRGRGLMNGSLPVFVVKFRQGKVNGYGAWHTHVASWLDAPLLDLLIIRYEDMQLAGCETLGKIAVFLGIETTVDRLKHILAHNTPQAMRQSEEKLSRAAFNFVHDDARFVRQAEVSHWREVLSPVQVEQIVAVMAPEMRRLGYG